MSDELPFGARIVREAMRWLGTPYRHQGCIRGVGCDCLGLVRGVWKGVYGTEAERPEPYGAGWAERQGEDRLLTAARAHCLEKPVDHARPGNLILFRWRTGAPARHCGILVDADHFIHAYDRHEVTVSALVPGWRRRIAGAFAFPEPSRVHGLHSEV